MLIKTTMRNWLTLVIMSVINTSNDKCWRGCKEKRNFIHCWWKCTVIATMRNSMNVPQNIKNGNINITI